eukprot:196073-Prymnesium_polylepis.1
MSTARAATPPQHSQIRAALLELPHTLSILGAALLESPSAQSHPSKLPQPFEPPPPLSRSICRPSPCELRPPP